MMETFRRAHDHRGCRLRRDLPELQRLQRRRLRGDHRQGQPGRDAHPARARRAHPLRRRPRARRGHGLRRQAAAIVDVADVGEDALLVHDETEPGSGLPAVPPVAAGPTSPPRSACSGPSSVPTTAPRSAASWPRPRSANGPGDLARPAALRRHLDGRLARPPAASLRALRRPGAIGPAVACRLRLRRSPRPRSTRPGGGTPRRCAAWVRRTWSSEACARRRGRSPRSGPPWPVAAGTRPGTRRACTRADDLIHAVLEGELVVGELGQRRVQSAGVQVAHPHEPSRGGGSATTPPWG